MYSSSEITQEDSEMSTGSNFTIDESIANSLVKIDEDDLLRFEDVLGEGGYAHVYEGIYQDRPVAIKTMKTGKKNWERSYNNELRFFATTKHENIVELEGYTDGPIHSLVMEYAPLGSLGDHLKRSGQIDWEHQGYSVALSVAKAMHYLHCENIIHGDIKSSNVLLNDRDKASYQDPQGNAQSLEQRRMHTTNAKLIDFGFSMTVDEAKNIKGNRGSPFWMAPETMVKNPRLYTESDIFSFGMMLFEMATGHHYKEYVSKFVNSKENVMNNWARGIVNKERPDLPANTPPKMAELIKNCWAHRREDRIKPANIIKKLEQFIHESSVEKSTSDHPLSRRMHTRSRGLESELPTNKRLFPG